MATPRRTPAPVTAGIILDALRSHVADLSWQDASLCAQADPEAFFPEKGRSTRAAKAVCARCPVRRPCLEYALGHGERFGIWGGLSERQRRRLERSRTTVIEAA